MVDAHLDRVQQVHAPLEILDPLDAPPEPPPRSRFKDFLMALPGFAVVVFLLWLIWPSGGLTVAFLGWLALGIVCAPLAIYLLFVAGFFWIFRRSARK